MTSTSDTTAFTSNYTSAAAGNGGVIYNTNSGTINSYGGVTYLTNHSGTGAGSGGAINNNAGTVNIKSNIFAGNYTGTTGSGVRF